MIYILGDTAFTQVVVMNTAPPKFIFLFVSPWKIQCKLPPKTKRFCPLVLK